MKPKWNIFCPLVIAVLVSYVILFHANNVKHVGRLSWPFIFPALLVWKAFFTYSYSIFEGYDVFGPPWLKGLLVAVNSAYLYLFYLGVGMLVKKLFPARATTQWQK